MLVEIECFVNWVRRRSPGTCTWKSYSSDLRLFVEAVGNHPPEQVTYCDIDQFVALQIERHLKPTTINRRLAAVISFYAFLSEENSNLICPVIPKRHRLREPQRLPRSVSKDDLHKFFSVFETDCSEQDLPFRAETLKMRTLSKRDHAMFLLMLRCGLRISEVAGLLMSDLYLDEPHPRLVARGKGQRERAVYLSPQAEEALRAYLVERSGTSSNHVFLSCMEKGLSTTAIHKRLMRYRERAGVRLTAHRLRHTFANDLIEANMPITSIQKLMGHRRLETTQVYVMANDLRVQADYYAACQKLETWCVPAT